MDNADTDNSISGMQPPVAPREALISTAMTFLNNPNVVRSPLSQKQKFLRSKGLTEDEIQIACDRCGVFVRDPNSTIINMGIPTTHAAPVYNQVQTKLSIVQRIRDVLSTTALFAGVGYALFLFYKNYIAPLLFGRKKKKKSVEDHLDELNISVTKRITDIGEELVKIREDVTKASRNDTTSREFSNFKSDLDAIKGLLLNRKQFSSPVVPPSIPVWQLQSQQTHVDTEVDKHDDAGSGSGSSETEVVTKNSDSSLEML